MATETPKVSPSQQTEAEKFIELLKQCTPQQRLVVAKLLGTTPTHKTKARNATEDAQSLVRAYGDIQRPAGWLPNPPEAVTLLGPEAEQMWLDAWEDDRLLTAEDITMGIQDKLAGGDITEIVGAFAK